MVKYINSLRNKELRGKRVLVRTDLNVPVEKGNVIDQFRIEKALPTVEYLSGVGAKVILISHIGRELHETLEPVGDILNKKLKNFAFVPDILGSEAQSVTGNIMNDGDVVLLENVRQYGREADNDEGFAEGLSNLADIYVNDAFAVSHRKHASIVGVPKFLPHYGGLLMREEIEHLTQARSPESPSLAIIGGAKFETKEPLIRVLLKAYDKVFIGGALANDIFKACGHEVGRSLVSKEIPSDDVFKDGHMIVPTDVVVERSDGQVRTVPVADVDEDEKIVDIGPESIHALEPYIQKAKSILWNGPMGMYEGGFDEQTNLLAELIAKNAGAAVVGGGDTVWAVTHRNDKDAFGFISTGGGAMLEFLLEGTLPGIEALE